MKTKSINLQAEIHVYGYRDKFFEKEALRIRLYNELSGKDDDWGSIFGGDEADEILNERVAKKIEAMPYKTMSPFTFRRTCDNDSSYISVAKMGKSQPDSDSTEIVEKPKVEEPRFAETNETKPSVIYQPDKTESDEESIEEKVDESYEGCYGLINHDVEDFVSELYEIDSDGNTAANAIAAFDELTLDMCKEGLSRITPDSFGPSERNEFIMYNYRLSCLRIAPRWRGIVRDKYFRSSRKVRTTQQEEYFQIIQIFDLEWMFNRYHGYIVDDTWGGTFDGIFTAPKFDAKQAALIAGMSMKPAKKAECLHLTADMEKELFMLRSPKTDRFINGLIEKSKKVRMDLHMAARRNGKRGQGLLENLERRVALWLASNLIPNSSLTLTIENYALITGETLKPSNCKRILKSMNDALNEVGSKYVQAKSPSKAVTKACPASPSLDMVKSS